jgi:hypothetical protein
VTLFLRMLEQPADGKPEMLQRVVKMLNEPGPVAASLDRLFFERDSASFSAAPGSPFAYWISQAVLNIFRTKPRLNSGNTTVVSTNPLNDDFRYIRAWWEISEHASGWKTWAKGGAYSPIYYDVETVVCWDPIRESYSGFLGTESRQRVRPVASVQYFFRPGLTWPRRTNGLSFRVMTKGSIFADKGPGVFVDGDTVETLLALSALLNSRIFGYLVSAQLARTELAQSYEVGLIQQTPVPTLSKSDAAVLAGLARRAWSLKRSLDTTNERSHAFVLPPGLNEKIFKLDRGAVGRELREIEKQIDLVVFSIYGIGPEDRVTIAAFSNHTPCSEPAGDCDTRDRAEAAAIDEGAPATAQADALAAWLVGVEFRRFDPRLATGERAIAPEPEPFDALPPRSPGMYPEGEQPADRLDILVDDEGHLDDLAERVRILAERVEVDVPESLRGWLAKEFFPLHIKMYSKSRRKAPMYWQLATPSSSYSVWLYIHAFNNDTLFRVQNDYVAPKLAHEERRLESLRSELRDGATATQRKALAAQKALVEDLRAFLDEVKRVAPLWKPNLDDGVVINFAPLWRLVPQNKSWQKELKATWDALCEGQYDWSHLAMHLWPERVVPKCAKDRSLAIAHGLEQVFWVERGDSKWLGRQPPTRSVEELVRERSSRAVKSALKDLLEAVACDGRSARPRGRRRTTAAGEGASG